MNWSAEALDAVLAKGHVRVHSIANARAVRRPENSAREKPFTWPDPPAVPKPIRTTEDLLAQQLADAGIALERQVRWHRTRKFRADFAHVESRLLVELDGAVHRTKLAFHADIRKCQEAIFEGWRLFRVSSRQVREERAVALIRKALECL